MTGISDPERTHALVVGIERYDPSLGNQNLIGPAHNACAFVSWLLDRGVPPHQIMLLIDPIGEVVVPARITHRTATIRNIRQMITNDLARTQSDTLFIFWGGHGIINSAHKRQLVAADTTLRDFQTLDVDSMLSYLRSDHVYHYHRQYCIFDVCGNHFNPPSLTPLEFPEGPLILGREQGALYASKLGEIAVNSRERRTGLFSEELLNQLSQTPRDRWPRMDQVIRRVIDIFTARSAQGDSSYAQTPTYYWHQDLAGSVKEEGSSPPGEPVTVRAFFEQLGFSFEEELSDEELLRLVFSSKAERETLDTLIDEHVSIHYVDKFDNLVSYDRVGGSESLIFITPPGCGKTFYRRYAEKHFDCKGNIAVSYNFRWWDEPIQFPTDLDEQVQYYKYLIIYNIVLVVYEKAVVNNMMTRLSREDRSFLTSVKGDVRKALSKPFSNVASFGQCLHRLLHIARAIEYNSIYLLVDDFSEFPPKREVLAQELFRQMLNQVYSQGIVLKIFLSDRTGALDTTTWVKEVSGHRENIERWRMQPFDGKQLIEILNSRLRAVRNASVYSNAKYPNELFVDLLDQEARLDIQRRIGQVTQGSLRNTLDLAQLIIRKHCERITHLDTKISNGAIEAAITVFLQSRAQH